MIVQVGRGDWYDWKIFDMYGTEIDGVYYYNSTGNEIEMYYISKGQLIYDEDRNPITIKLKISGVKAIHKDNWK